MSLEVRKYKFEERNSHDIFELELIPDAEVSGKLEALSLSNIEGSVLSNVSLCDITSVENSFLEDFSTANTLFSRIKDYNSNSKEEPKNDLASPMTTTDFEAL